MTKPTADFIDSLDSRVDGIIDACTACGKCVEVCPTPALSGIADVEPEAVAAGVLDILRGEAGPDPSRTWATVCCGSGHCLAVCEHGINPRFMLNMARRAMTREIADRERR